MKSITNTPETHSCNNKKAAPQPFSCIDGTVNLLFVDDQELILDLLEETFKPLKIFSLFRAKTAREALNLLSSTRIHTCVMDLGVSDLNGDEFTLLKNFGSKVAFIVLTGSHYPSKGFDSYRLGAKAVIEKTSAFESDSLMLTVNRCALFNLVNPSYHEHDNSTTAQSTKILFEHSPATVTDWALILNLTDRQLRKCWTNNPGFSAKSALSLYHLYNQAFLYYEHLLKCPDRPNTAYPLSGYKKLEEFFMLHKSTILKYLS